ncbi:MAG: RHS repeat protein, partial [Gammaproteobacteria bacterium]|nr:RHS repeat protein [Gammaproteobacteria bacterium]
TTSTVYDANGQFPVSTKNALNHQETRTWDARFGVPTSLTGPNGITTSWEYDSFGRKQLETRADGTTTTTTREWCNGFNGEAGNTNCPSGGARVMTRQKTGSPAVSIYSDKLGRTIREETRGFDGTPIYSDTVYNARGQVHKKSRPYFSGEGAYWHTYTYDIAGRLLTATLPDNSPSTTSYSGLATTVTNSKLQSTTQIKNVIGELRQVIDAEGNKNTYRYDPFGNLVTTEDALGNTITARYDIRGNKITMNDPDMGLWTYGHNTLGELVRQTDAKGNSSTTAYDKLGRKTQRTELEGVSNWAYDTANKGVGKPASSTGAEGIQKSASYDNLGRPYSSTTTIDGVTYT